MMELLEENQELKETLLEVAAFIDDDGLPCWCCRSLEGKPHADECLRARRLTKEIKYRKSMEGDWLQNGFSDILVIGTSKELKGRVRELITVLGIIVSFLLHPDIISFTNRAKINGVPILILIDRSIKWAEEGL